MQAEVDAVWLWAYRVSLNRLTDAEIAWEASLWRAGGWEAVAEAGDRLLAERARTGRGVPGGADADCLTRLLRRAKAGPARRLVEDETLCLVEAIRIVYWSSLRAREAS